MKKTPFNKALQDIKSISLTPAEKQALLARIVATRDTVMEGSETAYPSPIKSPWTVFSFSSWITTHRFVTAVAAFLIIAVSGNTIVLAANEALPGDALYSFKVNVAEPVRVALATDPIKKAEIQTDLVQARFEEAEVLAARGELDDEKEQEISDRIDRHIAAVSKNVEEVQKTSPEEAEDANIAVEASMNAHSKILATLEARKAKAWQANAGRMAAKARETAKRFEVSSDEGELAVAAAVTVAAQAPQTMMMSVATTAPAPEADDADLSVSTEAGGAENSRSARMTKTAPVKDVSDDAKDDPTDDKKVEKKSGSSTTTPMTIEFKKQKKEQEVYEKARQRLDKEFKKEELRVSKRDQDKGSDGADDDSKDEESDDRDQGGWKGRSGRGGSRE